MSTMTLRSLALRASGMALALAATLGQAPAALADTGGPLPQGYTSDVTAAPQPAAAPVANAGGTPAPVAEDPADGDPDQFADTDPSALTDFRDALAPYGQWMDDPTYGTIWVPDPAQVGADFAPYQTAGQWVVDDDDDWMWQSDYAWGYIPFHYGRWVWAGSYWGWIPGRRYAPAWVAWRVGDGGYVGWAPLPPSWYWANGAAVGLWSRPYAAYCFVPTNYMFARGVGSYVVHDRGMVGSIAAGTRPYHPASPTTGPHHPTFSEAHIPASAVPRARFGADVRASAFATRSSTAAFRGYGSRYGSRTLGQASRAPGYYGGVNRAPGYHGGASRAPAYSAGASRAPAYYREGSWRSGYQMPSRTLSSGYRSPASYGGESRAYYRGGGYGGGYASPMRSSPRFSAPRYSSSFGAYGGYHPQMARPSFSRSYSAPAVSHFARSSGVRVGGGGRSGRR